MVKSLVCWRTQWREEIVEAQRLLEAVGSALQADGERLLSTEERAAIVAQMSELQQALQSQDVVFLARKVKQLSDITDAFAARRMDSSVQAALTGRRLNEIEE